MRNVFYFLKKVRLFSQNDVLFLFYFLINPAGTTEPEIFGIFQHKVEGIPHFARVSEVRHMFSSEFF